LADFSYKHSTTYQAGKYIPNEQKSTKWAKIYQMSKNLPNEQKNYQMSKNPPHGHKYIPICRKYSIWPKNIPNGFKICQKIPFQDRPKCTKSWSYCKYIIRQPGWER
jgi:hypothetical protein